MTVPANVDYRVVHDGDGSDTQFTFPFNVFAAADLRVVKVDSNGVESELSLDAAGGFSVTFNGDLPSAGYITYPIDVNGTTLATGESIVVMRNMDYSQETDITNAGSFRAQVIENALDKLTMLVQQLKDSMDRAIVAPISTPLGTTYELPVPAAGAFLAWNGSEDGLENIESDGSNLLEQIDSEHFVIDTFSGTGAQTDFTLSATPGHENACDVFIDGVRQASVDSSNNAKYSVSGTTFTFATAPPSGTRNVQVKFRQYTTSTSTTPADTSVTTSKLASGAVTFAKMAGECAVATQTLSAAALPAINPGILSFSTTLAGPSTAKIFSFKLTCTHASGDAGYAQYNTVVVDQGFFTDGVIDSESTKHYGFAVRNPGNTSFNICTAKNGIAIPHKTTGVITALTADRWTITPSVIGW
jgi:hypothetical protein